ncbi:MAG: RNA polymerase sigma factor, partial [Brevundimonas sp.]
MFRAERARVIAAVASIARDLDVAEDLAHEALIAALEIWPETGVPARPGAWLTTVARRRALDLVRRQARRNANAAELGRIADADRDAAALRDQLSPDQDIGDELLGLMFIACHPELMREQRVALTLRLVAGLSTAEIARAFLVGEAALAQRIVRAKRRLRSSRAGFDLPRGEDRSRRVSSVMEVIYLVFNEGYSATRGAAPTRPEVCLEARRLARVLAGLVPDDPEVWGLLSLVELQSSRLRARLSPQGRLVPVLEQDRSLWDVDARR